jgi:hypothetical protein
MNHAVTVGAQKAKVPEPSFVARSPSVNGFGVMALDETFTAVPVPLAEVKPASLTSQPPESGERAAFPSLG